MAKSSQNVEYVPGSLHVYQAISAVQADIIELGGIAKGRENKEQNFWFRGFEDVVSVVSPLLVKHKIVFLPTVRAVEYLVRETPAYKEGQAPKRAAVTFIQMDFRIVSLVDGSETIVQSVGEGKDHGDKATNKAMTIALKYAMTMAFQIPTYVDDQEEDGNSETGGASADGPITAEQLVALRELIKQLNVPETIPCRVFKVGKLEDLTSSQFPSAERKLRATIEKKEAGGG